MVGRYLVVFSVSLTYGTNKLCISETHTVAIRLSRYLIVELEVLFRFAPFFTGEEEERKKKSANYVFWRSRKNYFFPFFLSNVRKITKGFIYQRTENMAFFFFRETLFNFLSHIGHPFPGYI